MINVKAKKHRSTRLSQGDLFRDVEYIESVTEEGGILAVSKIVFPLVVVLTQDCDLKWDAAVRQDVGGAKNQDKALFSVLVAPLYNAEHVYEGSHLRDLDLKMAEINPKKSPGQTLRQNERPRYHYLEFPATIPVVPSVVDFKHYFSVAVDYLSRIRRKNFVCRLSDLYREDLSLRFANYLARIGLPEIPEPDTTK